MMSNRQERIYEIVAETFGLAPLQIDETTSAQTLSTWTSLAHLRLIANLEQAFGLRFTIDEMTVMTSVQTIESVLATHGVQA